MITAVKFGLVHLHKPLSSPNIPCGLAMPSLPFGIWDLNQHWFLSSFMAWCFHIQVKYVVFVSITTRQCCISVTQTLANICQGNCAQISNFFMQEKAFENVVCKMPTIFIKPPQAQYGKAGHWNSSSPQIAQQLWYSVYSWSTVSRQPLS